MKEEVVLFWFRRDLRIEDNTGLYYALQSGHRVLPIFIFDPQILDQLENSYDRRVDYIHQAITSLNKQFACFESGISVFHNDNSNVFNELISTYNIQGVYCNEDYEPTALKRDERIRSLLTENSIPFHSYKDQVIFAKNEVVKSDGKPYTVYTPYANSWKKRLDLKDYSPFVVKLNNDLLFQTSSVIMSLDSLGFDKTSISFEPIDLQSLVINRYEEVRDYPAMDETTRIGIALRFGTVSIRACVAFALVENATWLSQLIWRDFFMQILYHFPSVQSQCFKPAYEAIEWRNNLSEFDAWCEGKTGYPIVDAGMRSLNATGFMHNRVRMVVASFLSKHLLIDWRWGEAYFAQKLDDYDLAANNGNWQWAAGCGCDAAPYFRVFSPDAQTKKFDKNLEYCRLWISELDELTYPLPIVDHAFARERVLKAYKKALAKV